jgi:hypothetical protein
MVQVEPAAPIVEAPCTVGSTPPLHLDHVVFRRNAEGHSLYRHYCTDALCHQHARSGTLESEGPRTAASLLMARHNQWDGAHKMESSG